MDNKSLQKKVGFYKEITKKYNMMTVYETRHCDKFSLKKLNKNEVLRLWTDFLKDNSDPFLSLYIHIPFCKDSRCYYCMYQSNVLRSPIQIDRYLDYLEEEAGLFSPAFSNNKFTTLYIGGGTPTTLNTKQLERLSDIIFNNFKFKSKLKNIEFKKITKKHYKETLHSNICSKCIEMSPTTLTQEKILLVKERGFNRISIGIQSLGKNVLKTANRKYIPFDVLKDIIEFVKIQGFEDFNVDLMAWLPDDTISKFTGGMEKIMQLNVPSITVYFYRHQPHKFRNLPPLKRYEKFVNYKFPYNRYELLESIKPLLKRYAYFPTHDNPNFECQRFLKKHHKRPVTYPLQPYWPLKNSALGLGLHACSFLKNSIWYINANADINNLDFKNSTYNVEMYPKKYQMRRYVLRRVEDASRVSVKDFKNIFGEDIFSVFGNEIDSLLELNKIKIQDDYIVFLTKGLFELSVYVKFFYNQEHLKKRVEAA